MEKKTRYEVEREHYNADGEVLRRELTLRGIVYDRLRRSAEAHMLARDNIVQALESHGINVQVLKAYDLTSEHVDDSDIIFTAGGDGTLLRTASKVKKNYIHPGNKKQKKQTQQQQQQQQGLIVYMQTQADALLWLFVVATFM